MTKKRAIIIGANIMGLALARSLAIKGYKVIVIEQDSIAKSSRLNSLGVVNTLSQQSVQHYEYALKSRSIWLEICQEAGIHVEKTGALIPVYYPEEFNAVSEFYNHHFFDRDIELLGKTETIKRFNGLDNKKLIASLYSKPEIAFDTQGAIEKIKSYYREKYKITFHFSKKDLAVEGNAVKIEHKIWEADQVFICKNDISRIVYPELINHSKASNYLTVHLRSNAEKNIKKIGTVVIGGVSILNYSSFEKLKTLSALKAIYHQHLPDYLSDGAQVLVKQNGQNELFFEAVFKYSKDNCKNDEHVLKAEVLSYINSLVKFRHQYIADVQSGFCSVAAKNSSVVYSPTSSISIIDEIGQSDLSIAFGIADKITVKF